MPDPGHVPGRRDPASYRDPAGFVFRRDGVVYRKVDESFATDWEAFARTGLRDRLIEQRPQEVGVDRLLEERERAELHRLHRGVDRAVPGQHHELRRRA